MQFGMKFYRAAAVCSVLSAVTTLLLIFLPDFFAPGDGYEARMARVHDPAYQLRSWVYFVHPFITMMAALAVAMRIRNFRPALAMVGLIAFILWGFTAGIIARLFDFVGWSSEWDTEQVRDLPDYMLHGDPTPTAPMRPNTRFEE